MKNNHQIEQELKNLGLKLPHNRLQPYEVPSGYFNQFSEQLSAQIHSDLFLESLPKNNPYQVSDSYFDQFSASLLEEIKQEHRLDLYPKSTPYQIPSGYFDRLPDVIRHKVSEQKLNRGLGVRKTLTAKLSIAATLLLFMGLAFKGLILGDSHPISAEQQLSMLSDAEIQNYLSEHQIEIESSFAIEQVDESKIDIQDLESDVLDKTFREISEEDLNNYIL